jgi:para-nitrobenzyl esterase
MRRSIGSKLKKCLWAATSIAAVTAAVAVTVTVAASRTAVAAAAPTCTAGTLVQTRDGPVCGLVANGVTSYLGIPYAAPPVGALRWQPPAPVTSWTTPFQATTPGNICPGPSSPGGPAIGTTDGNEDCLNLNVQVPANPGVGRLPVMVEIHGGGFLLPIGPSDGTHLVTAGHVVYVAMNYRLGILGFMANKAFGPHSGDYGLQDQQAALRWVQRNIARFGGDPQNVTIFGQSAGGASVCANVASPTAKGLFQRGISESGLYNSALGPNAVWEAADCKSQLPTHAQAQQAGAAFAAKVGCGTAADVVACLRAVPVPTLIANAGQLLAPTAGGTIAPTINGTTLPMSPGKAFATGHLDKVGLTIGVDRDEINGGASTSAPVANTPAQYRALVKQKYGPLAPAVFALYPLSRFPTPSPYIAYRTIVADADSVCPALVADQRLAKHIPTYAYENDDADSPPGPFSSGPFSFLDPTKPNGSYHIAEVPFLFPNSTSTLDANQAALAAQVTAEWTGYARTGNPTVAGTPRWTRYNKTNPDVMSLVEAGDSALDPTDTLDLQHNCGFWDAVTPTPRH